MCRNLEICRYKWLCMTTKSAMDAYISTQAERDFPSAAISLFPEFSFLCCVKEVAPSNFMFAVLADGLKKPPPLKVTVEGKMDAESLSKIKPFFENSESSATFSNQNISETKFSNNGTVIVLDCALKKAGDLEDESGGLEIGYSELVMIPLENYHNMQRQFAAIVNVDSILLKNEILNPAMICGFRTGFCEILTLLDEL